MNLEQFLMIKQAGGNILSRAKKHALRMQMGRNPATNGTPSHPVITGSEALGRKLDESINTVDKVKKLSSNQWHRHELVPGYGWEEPQEAFRILSKNPAAKRLSSGAYGKVMNNPKLKAQFKEEARRISNGSYSVDPYSPELGERIVKTLRPDIPAGLPNPRDLSRYVNLKDHFGALGYNERAAARMADAIKNGKPFWY